LEQLAEERRASAHALYTLGHGHPDLPDLAHAYGTYFEHAVPPKDVFPPRPENPRLDRLQHSLWRRLNYPQNHIKFEGVPTQLEMANFAGQATQARQRAVARDVTPLEAEVKRLSANLPFASESDRARLNARIAHYQGRIKKLVDFHVSQGRDEALARLDFRQKLQDRVRQNTQTEMSRLKRFREPEPTFKDYAALTGEGRRNLESWLSYTAEPALRRAFNYDVSKPAVDQIYQALREARR
jgi:hypothetical protein